MAVANNCHLTAIAATATLTVSACTQEIVGLDKRNRQVTANWRRLAYKPVVHLDEVGLTSDMYMPLNTTLTRCVITALTDLQASAHS
jgi:hypothetical protein